MKVKVINPSEHPRWNKMHGYKTHCHCQLRPNLGWQMVCLNGFFIDTPKEVFVMQSRINARSLKMLDYQIRRDLSKMRKELQ